VSAIIHETKAIGYIVKKTKKNYSLLVYSINSDTYKYLRLPGGGVLQNEEPFDGLFREIEEEIGIKKSELTYLRKIGTIKYFKPNNYKFIERNDYLLLYNGGLESNYEYQIKSNDKDDGVKLNCKWITNDDFSIIDPELRQFLNEYNTPELFIKTKEYGLEKGKLAFSDYTNMWDTIYRLEEFEINNGEKPVFNTMHIGSTSVPGLIAKPIIDILIGIKNDDERNRLRTKLEAIGYEFRGENGIKGRDYYIKGNKGIVLFHLHALFESSEEYRNHLVVADRLRNSKVLKEKYERYKRASLSLTREEYTNGKDIIMKEIIAG